MDKSQISWKDKVKPFTGKKRKQQMNPEDQLHGKDPFTPETQTQYSKLEKSDFEREYSILSVLVEINLD